MDDQIVAEDKQIFVKSFKTGGTNTCITVNVFAERSKEVHVIS